MKYKPDWESARERVVRFWQGECGIIQIVAPKDMNLARRDQSAEDTLKKSNPIRFWTDIQHVLERKERQFANSYFAGEAFPNFFVNLGPGITAACLEGSSGPEFKDDTVWFSPSMEDLSSPLRIGARNRWFDLVIEMTEAALGAGKGKYLVSTTDLGGPTDLLASLRGTEQLCMDIVDDPIGVRTALDSLTEIWKEFYTRLDELIRPAFGGSVSRHLWAPGSHYPLQCDFATVISTAMFDDVVLPEIRSQVDFLDFVEFHLDGPGVARHIDALLEIPKIALIQWVYGDGNPTTGYWIPMLKKIQSAGRSVLIYADASTPPGRDEIKLLLSELDPRRMCLNVSGVSAPGDADDLVALFRNAQRAK
jgi:hypothetical protein